MSELTDVEVLIIIIFLVILSTIYGINEIKSANQRIKQLKCLVEKFKQQYRKDEYIKCKDCKFW